MKYHITFTWYYGGVINHGFIMQPFHALLRDRVQFLLIATYAAYMHHPLHVMLRHSDKMPHVVSYLQGNSLVGKI